MAKKAFSLGNKQGHSSSDPILCVNALNPGNKVWMDQYILALGGRLPNKMGKKPKKNNGGPFSVIMPHSIFIFQNNLLRGLEKLFKPNVGLKEKWHNLESKIKSNLADSHPFGTNKFQAELNNNGQDINFSGINAHHKNAVAEQSIQTITWWAREMLLSAMIMWPDQTNLELRPLAMAHGTCLLLLESIAAKGPWTGTH